MKPNAKKLSITREVYETITMRLRRENRAFCADCKAENDFLTLDETVSLYSIGTRRVLRGISGREIHFLETARGHLLICRQSLEEFNREI